MKLIIFLVGIMLGQLISYGIISVAPRAEAKPVARVEKSCSIHDDPQVRQFVALLEKMPTVKRKKK